MAVHWEIQFSGWGGHQYKGGDCFKTRGLGKKRASVLKGVDTPNAHYALEHKVGLSCVRWSHLMIGLFKND